MIQIQEIIKHTLNSNKNEFEYNIKNTLQQIANCHTDKLGYLLIDCNKCNHQEVITKSCRNRNCPICQKSAQEKWVNKRLKQMIDCSYYHIVATTPDVLYHIMYENQEIMYKILQKASSKAIIKLAEDKKNLGAKVGIIQIIHTWTQRMLYHPHCHMLVTNGGIKNNEWIEPKNEKYIFPIKAYSRVYRGIFIEELQKNRKKLKFRREKTKKYKNENNWKKLINELYKKEFVTYVKEPYENPMTVMDYFGRYAYRVAITESRIISYKNGEVEFKYKDRKDGNKEKIEKITDEEFVKRFSMHILPKGFRKIKAYGIFSNAYLNERITQIKEILYKIRQRVLNFVKEEIHKRCCPACGSELIEIISLGIQLKPT